MGIASANRLLQLLKRGDRTEVAPAERIADPPSNNGKSLGNPNDDLKKRASEINPSPLELKDLERENLYPLETAYEGEVKPGGLIRLYAFLKNMTNENWDEVFLRLENSQELHYVLGTTFCDGENIPDQGGTSPVLSSEGVSLKKFPPDGKRKIAVQMEIDSAAPENSCIETSFFLKKRGEALFKQQGSLLLKGDLQFSKSDCSLFSEAKETIKPGEVISCAVTLFNPGQVEITRVSVLLKSSAHLAYIPGSAVIDDRPILDPVSGELLFSQQGLYLASLRPKEKRTLKFQVKADFPLDCGEIVSISGGIQSDQSSLLELDPLKFIVQSSPEFSTGKNTLIRSLVDKEVNATELIPYVIQYQNSGDANAYGTVIRIESSPSLELVPGSLRIEENQVSQETLLFSKGISLGTIKPGQIGKIAFQMRIKTPIENGTDAAVKGILSFLKGDDLEIPQVTHKITAKPFFADPKLNWIEVHPKGDVKPGDLLTYTLCLRNSGEALHAYQTRVRCLIPPELTCIPGTLSINGVKSKKEVSTLISEEGLELGQVKFGENQEISFQASVKSPLDNGIVLEVGGEIKAQDIDAYRILPSKSEVHAKPDFSQGINNFVDVRPGKEASPGEVLTYTIHCKNAGLVHAKNIAIFADLPEHTQYIPNKMKRNGIPVPDEEKNSPLFMPEGFNLGPLKVGDQEFITFQVKVNSPLEVGTILRGKVRIIPDKLATYILEIPPVSVCSSPDFSNPDTNFMEAFPDTPIPPGQMVTYVLYYRNVGNDDAKGIILKAGCPLKANYVKGSTRLNGIPVPDLQGTSPLFGKGLRVEDVKWNRSGNISYQVVALENIEPGAILENSGSIEWNGRSFKTNAVKNSIISLVDFSNKKYNHLSVSVPGDVAPGMLLTYTFRFKNEGTVSANGVTAKMHLSPHLQYVSNSTIVNGQPASDQFGKSPVLQNDGLAVGNVYPGQAEEISLRCVVETPLDPGIEIFASGEIILENNQSFAIEKIKNIVASSPSFRDKSFNHIEAVYPPKMHGNPVAFIVNFKNTGNSNAYHIVFRGNIPKGWRYVKNSTCFNGRGVKDEQDESPLFLNSGLTAARIEADEEGTFSFQAYLPQGISLGKEGDKEFPRITVESQKMDPYEIFPKG